MQIFVDADACPVVDIVETIAEKYNISTTLLCDTNHILYSDYSEVIVEWTGQGTFGLLRNSEIGNALLVIYKVSLKVISFL